MSYIKMSLHKNILHELFYYLFFKFKRKLIYKMILVNQKKFSSLMFIYTPIITYYTLHFTLTLFEKNALKNIQKIQELNNTLYEHDPYGKFQRTQNIKQIYKNQRTRFAYYINIFGYSYGYYFYKLLSCPLKQDPNTRVRIYLESEQKKLMKL